MKLESVTARINLKKKPYYFEHRAFFAWDIYFDTQVKYLNNILGIYCRETEPEAQAFYEDLINSFWKANLHDGDEVTVLLTSNGNVRAFSRFQQDDWFDVEDRLIRKTFKELNISLK